MPLTLMYITNDTEIALIAERCGVDRIWVDLETLGKEERQKNIDCVKSKHTVGDVHRISKVLTQAELMVRINPWNSKSEEEIENVIAAGAQRIMLPMWKSCAEAKCFLGAVNRRVHTTLLLETKEAVACIDEVLKDPLIDEIHIGLNDLHLSYGLTFMFELLSNGTVEALCQKFKEANIPFGFGGIAKIGEGMLPAEKIVMEHYRLGSTRTILSRSFCNADKAESIHSFDKIFCANMSELRELEKSILSLPNEEYLSNQEQLAICVKKIVRSIEEKKSHVLCNTKNF